MRIASLVVGLGLLTASDLRVLERLAENFAAEVQLREMPDREGWAISTGTNCSNAHRTLRAVSDARESHRPARRILA